MPKSRLALLLIPFLFAACSQNNVTVDDSLQKYFDSAGVKGTFALFDNGQGHFTIYNLPRYRDSAYQPSSTFDILQTLIAIQIGVLQDDSSYLFDGPMGIKIDNDLGDSMKPGDVANQFKLRACFQGGIQDAAGFTMLLLRIGNDSLKKWIDSLHYGNRDMGGDPGLFWVNNHLKISADEQLGLIKKLYFNQLPFFQRTQKLVVSLFPSEGNSNYHLYYKTATGKMENGHTIAWVMGWVEENKHPYFFVVNLESADPQKDLRQAGLQIVRSILAKMGFFNGTK